MITISSGHSVEYLTKAVAGGRENYYSKAVAAGEPPGHWYGRGAAALGLHGEVDADVIQALYSRFKDPRDPRFADPATRDDAAALPGRRAYTYVSAEDAYAAALEREPDATPERREELRLLAEKTSRQAVAFHDVTFSVQKSVTVLHAAFEAQEVAARSVGDVERAAAWSTYREAVEEAIWAGNRSALDYLQDVAGYARVGYHRPEGGGRFVDAHDWVGASFFQHTSRDNDPQLHIHNAVLNRVECPDGKWRTLDSRAIHRHRGAAGAIAERTMEEYLSRTLGVRFAMRPDGKAREVLGVPPQVMDLFSARRRAITGKTRQLVAAFEAKYGREPNALELDRLSRQATMATRAAKQRADQVETVEERLERWNTQLRTEIDSSLAAVAYDVLGRAGTTAADEFSPRAVIETALAEVQSTKTAWHRGDLIRAVNQALPDSLGGLGAVEVRRLVESLADLALRSRETGELPGGAVSRHGVAALTYDLAGEQVPPELTLADGRSAYLPPSGRLYATVGQLSAERALCAAAVRRGRPGVSGEAAAEALARYREATGVELGVDQAAAVRGVLTSRAEVEVLVGPAGTGKSRTVGALAAAWSDPATWQQRTTPPRVVGLAASQIAAEVLAGEGLQAGNIARWLAAQRRLQDGRGRDEDLTWRLHGGDLVIVDEASMADTAAIAEIHRHAARAGAKVLLTGDHRQLAAVGAGGAFDLVARQAVTYELAEVRRFAAQWECEASLRLREGDPSAVRDYARHGRLIDAGTIEQAATAARLAWLADTLDGLRSLLLVDTNEQAAAVSAQARADLVRLGLVAEDGVSLEHDGNRAGVGDLVQARLLAPQLRGFEGNTAGPVNREYYRVTGIRGDGGLVVAPIAGTGPDGEQLGAPMHLPGRYVRDHVTLGYACTVHSAQGATVDTSHTVVSQQTSAAGAYVGLTRGREVNTAYVATVATGRDAPAGEAHQGERRSPAAVVADVIERNEPEEAALIVAKKSAAQARSIATVVGIQLQQAGQMLAQRHHAALFDRLTDRGLLSTNERAALAADASTSALSQLLRTAQLAGHDVEQVLSVALADRSLAGARSVAQVLHHRISEQLAGRLTPTGDTFTDRLPPQIPPSWARYVHDLAERADARRCELGAEVAEQAPQWAVEALGPVPEDPAEREEWKQRAGIVAAHRELTDHDDPVQPIGPAPQFGAVDRRASWHAAWRALGRPEASTEDAELPTGALRMRVAAYQREETWSPPWVGEELATAAQAAARYRQYAALARAEAKTATDTATQQAAAERAGEAAAMAGVLAEQQRRLEVADTARGAWYAHTAATRQAAYRARAELARRGVDIEEPPDAVTAEEWLAAQAEAIKAEDTWREVGPADVGDEHTTRAVDLAAAFGDQRAETEAYQVDQPSPAAPVEHIEATTVPAVPMPAGVPSLAETSAQVLRAQAALLRLADRVDLQARRQADEEAMQAVRIHQDRAGLAETAGTYAYADDVALQRG